MTSFNKLQQLKRRFFALRNGAVADSMRKSGANYRIIFGLNLPQLAEVASEFGPDAQLALQLRDNLTTRESLLIAPMLYPTDSLTPEVALEWIRLSPTPEVIDILCLKLLRHLSDPAPVITELAASDSPLDRYAALRLSANILPREMDIVESVARSEAERRDPLTLLAATMIIDDIEFRREPMG
ncbi:MAG: hypothetical protein HDS75_00350 [Bacteroidales bacterium]|nr:hypothetical protein [Bacteroidales bacterium]